MSMLPSSSVHQTQQLTYLLARAKTTHSLTHSLTHLLILNYLYLYIITYLLTMKIDEMMLINILNQPIKIKRLAWYDDPH